MGASFLRGILGDDNDSFIFGPFMLLLHLLLLKYHMLGEVKCHSYTIHCVSHRRELFAAVLCCYSHHETCCIDQAIRHCSFTQSLRLLRIPHPQQLRESGMIWLKRT